MAQPYESGPLPQGQRQPHESIPGGAARRGQAVSVPASERSTAEIVKDIAGNLQDIMRSEIELARSEMTQKALEGGKAAAVAVAGGTLALYALAFLLVCIFDAIALAIPYWAAALAIAVPLMLISALMLAAGIRRLRQINPKPAQTIRSIRENVTWFRKQPR
jgi:uncharacterized membrane protein YqjE